MIDFGATNPLLGSAPQPWFLVLQLFIILIPGILVGCLAAVLATERRTRVWPVVLACIAIAATIGGLYSAPRAFKGFDLWTLWSTIPLGLGSWVLLDFATRPTKTPPADLRRFSLRTILNLAACFCLALGCMAYQDAQSKAREQMHRVNDLLIQARLAIDMPEIEESDKSTGLPDAVDAIQLCNEAIKLAPNNGEAYDIRADAYDQMGDTQKAKQDRKRARELGF